MWSFGCILHELLHYTILSERSEFKNYKQQRFLFKGKSCFPISPLTNDNDGIEKQIIGSQDQLLLIMKGLGPLKSNQLSFITGNTIMKYLTEL